MPVVVRFMHLVLQETRGAVLLVYLMRCLAGAFSQPFFPTFQLFGQLVLSTVSMLFAVMCVYLYNGLTDVAQDRVNGSTRPLASGALSSTTVRYTIGVLIVVDATIGLAVPLCTSICNASMLLLGFTYSGGRHPAKMHGTLALVVAGAGATLPYLSTSFVAAGRLSPEVLTSAAMLGAWVWAGGAAKDLSDVRGDTAAGRATLPIQVGELQARKVIARRLALVGCLAATLAALGLALPAMLLMPVCATALIIVSLRDRRTPDQRGTRRLYRTFMLSQYALNGALFVLPVVG